ncbi:hypothetical protein [Sinorhizobium meliloti]|uniref:hypothetical protein n=1 Tax=Rhizobium meliloti TaxID=382 RepID=UPI000FDC58B0|nr:hypothetical protein [Sinorhizobium meliloti]RVE78447.1 hypothetical protein CN238_34200 [Sinorhizobium meliloti]RVH24039.1 hypothetical protein CN214_26370 [Sinorhizobium meliloti]
MASDTLALLIDGDNAPPKIVTGLLAEIANYGVASVKRINGDWTDPNLKCWKSACLSIPFSWSRSSPTRPARTLPMAP